MTTREPLPSREVRFHFCLSRLLYSHAFSAVRENLHTFHQREKDRYDLSAIEKIFKLGDRVRVRLKYRENGLTKFSSEWSSPHEILSVKGVVVKMRELASGREYVTHHDRLSDPLFSGEVQLSKDVKSNANPVENAQEFEDDREPVGNPEEALMSTRHGRVVRPPRDPNFDYSFVLPGSLCIRISSTSRTSMTISTYSFYASASCIPHVAHAGTAIPLQESRIRREQRACAASLGELVQWVTDSGGV